MGMGLGTRMVSVSAELAYWVRKICGKEEVSWMVVSIKMMVDKE